MSVSAIPARVPGRRISYAHENVPPVRPARSLLLDAAQPAGLPALVSNIIDGFDLAPFLAAHNEPREMPPYHPAMMLKVLLYGYATWTRRSCSRGASRRKPIRPGKPGASTLN